MTDGNTPETTQVYRVYIKATPDAVWEAITQPEWTVRYGYAPLLEYELRAGGSFRARANEGMTALGCPEIISDGEVIEADPPRRLVQTWRMTMTPEMAAEAFTRLTYDIEAVRGGVTKLTVTHDVAGAPLWGTVLRGEAEAGGAGGGWAEILSGLKTLLETGEQLAFQSGPANL
ncbi:MAG: SRPBCC domain-containing protein [Acidobacteriota bacterium]|nr:SRPBCC domain-containing protein [Acidobacteriota bacterium]